MGKHAYARSAALPKGRHRRPAEHHSLARSSAAAGGLTVGVLVAGGLTAPLAHAATADDFARLRMCESGGNYHTNTGNGYYGAYQFALGTWRSLGYSGKPSDASPATQDAAARQLQARSGWGQWPACSRRLGLGSSSHHAVTSHRFVAATTTSRPVIVHPTGPVALSVADVDTWRADVRDLQSRLALVGYTLTVDGHFGAETATVVRQFQQANAIAVDGQVGPQTQKVLQQQLVVVAQMVNLAARM